LIPVWPHQKYAEACAIGPWAGATPEAISVDHWMKKWIPGLTGVGREIAVFPIPSGAGIRVSTEQFAADLASALREIE
jgi:hypothetical protein